MFEAFKLYMGGHLSMMGGSRRLGKGLRESSKAQVCVKVSKKTSWGRFWYSPPQIERFYPLIANSYGSNNSQARGCNGWLPPP